MIGSGRHSRVTVSLGVVLACSVLGGLVACATPGSRSPTPTAPTTTHPHHRGAVQLPENAAVIQEYVDTVKHFPLPLPRGESFPDTPMVQLPAGNYQAGAGAGPAYFYWLCAWEAEYVKSEQASHPAATKDALARLSQWMQTDFAHNYISDADGGWAATVLAPAQAGDPSGVQGDMRACPSLGVVIP